MRDDRKDGRKISRKKMQSSATPTVAKKRSARTASQRASLRARLSLIGILILIQAAGCHINNDDDSIGVAECDQYVNTMSHCMGRTRESLTAMRTSLQSRVKDANGDEAALKALAAQCSGGERSAEKVCR